MGSAKRKISETLSRTGPLTVDSCKRPRSVNFKPLKLENKTCNLMFSKVSLRSAQYLNKYLAESGHTKKQCSFIENDPITYELYDHFFDWKFYTLSKRQTNLFRKNVLYFDLYKNWKEFINKKFYRKTGNRQKHNWIVASWFLKIWRIYFAMRTGFKCRTCKHKEIFSLRWIKKKRYWSKWLCRLIRQWLRSWKRWNTIKIKSNF